MSDMRRDLEELGAALWPDTNELRPGSGAAGPSQRNPQRRRGLEPLVTATAAVLLIAALVAAIALGRATSPYVATPVPAKPIVAIAGVTAAELAKGHWSQLPAAPIGGRTGASVVWTGTELLVWGGQSVAQPYVAHADGAAYNPQTGAWRMLRAAPLSPRFGQASAWDGTEMLVWGGYDGQPNATDGVADNGAAYDPTGNRWRALPRAPLSARAGAIAVWTGTSMVVLGGYADGSGQGTPRDGAAYNPATDRWTHIPAPTPPGQHSLMWTSALEAGSQLLAFSDWATSTPCGGGCTEGAGGTDVYAYDVRSDGWHLVPAASGALSGADQVFWTGSVVIARGGQWCGGCAGPAQPQRSAAYDPARNTWTQLPADPLSWGNPGSAWTGAALFSFNSGVTRYSPAPPTGPLNPGDSTAYDPNAGWVHLPSAPSGCGGIESPRPVWTGHEVLLACPSHAPGFGAGGLALTPGH